MSEKDLTIIEGLDMGREDDADACSVAGYILQSYRSDVINSPLKFVIDCRLHTLGSRMFKNGARAPPVCFLIGYVFGSILV